MLIVPCGASLGPLIRGHFSVLKGQIWSCCLSWQIWLQGESGCCDQRICYLVYCERIQVKVGICRNYALNLVDIRQRELFAGPPGQIGQCLPTGVERAQQELKAGIPIGRKYRTYDREMVALLGPRQFWCGELPPDRADIARPYRAVNNLGLNRLYLIYLTIS